MAYNIRIVSTYPPRKCGVGIFARNLATALENFTGEVASVKVAAIRRSDEFAEIYAAPVDLTVDQYDPRSWKNGASAILTRAREASDPTIVLLQHEYGLDPDRDGEDGRGKNFVDLAARLEKGGLLTLAYLHTVLDDPSNHQRKVVRELAKHTEGLIVTTESAIDLLVSKAYGVNRARIRHIDHGVRIHLATQDDRLAIKEKYGLDDQFLIVTLGLQSPDKGIQFSIRAYARFLEESCTEAQRRHFLYLVAGQCHPEFIRADNGRPYNAYQAMIRMTLQKSELKWCEVKDLHDISFADYDVVLLDTFIDENMLLQLYGAANVVVLPYLNMRQISSGILADAIGSGRVAVATKFMYALELLNPKCQQRDGVLMDPYARGILVDPGAPSVGQIAQALDYVAFDTEARFRMENRAYARGVEMKWDNVAWKLLQYIDFSRGKRDRIMDTSIQFDREKESALAQANAALLGEHDHTTVV